MTGPAGTASYVYDPAGRLVQRQDGAGTSLFDWTARSELDFATEGLSGVQIDYVWDQASQLDSVSYGAGGAVRDYAYDDRGLLTLDRLEDSVGGLLTETVYDYDADANVVLRDVTMPTNPDAGTNSYEYDNAGRLDSWTLNTVVADVVWDDAGNRLGMGADVYTYDARNRLLTGPEATYAYSPRGTIASLDDGVVPTSYVFDGLSRSDAFSARSDWNAARTVGPRGADRWAGPRWVGPVGPQDSDRGDRDDGRDVGEEQRRYAARDLALQHGGCSAQLPRPSFRPHTRATSALLRRATYWSLACSSSACHRFEYHRGGGSDGANRDPAWSAERQAVLHWNAYRCL